MKHVPAHSIGKKQCSSCRESKRLDEFPARKDAPDGRRTVCNECTNKRSLASRQKRVESRDESRDELRITPQCGEPVYVRWPNVEAFDAEPVAEQSAVQDDATAQSPAGELIEIVDAGMIAFGTPIQRVTAEALLRLGSIAAAAAELQLTPAQLRAHLSELARRAAARGYAPDADMTKATPEGFSVKGVSTLYDAEGNISAQWVKTRRDEDGSLAALLDAASTLSYRWTGLADPVDAPSNALDDDLLCVYPMGDPHFGMYSWAEETGNDFDLDIAERNLCAAVDHLVSLAPPSREALIIELGDFFHSDSQANTTTAGTRVDVDTRWAKVLRAGIRTMRRNIDRCLEKHEKVRVIIEIGNHDTNTSMMLALCLSQYYEREPRVDVDTSPAKFHWYRFGANLVASTHTDTVKPKDLPAVMACDRAQDWGETEYRYFYTGHVHHDAVKEFPGVTVESFRTLAPADAWHRGQGYRSGRDMKLDILHRKWGRIQRHVVGINQVCSANG